MDARDEGETRISRQAETKFHEAESGILFSFPGFIERIALFLPGVDAAIK
jgi:hypothetical protein